ncbi:ubiquitin carboxyl-terminal hydrolase 4 isoform X2 [Bos indicus]|uniref:Ubiquitin carboxyl-terminal hydrolase n=3 Tax=Bos TaxID=9903 RepID=A0A3Q1N7X1_BOVIN|nr:ubiquitin carboxyl-terminal hydrolase 4 isoform X1 [Bos taurus]XP_019840240.1 PREDICTED: ubiquitin carboxyl-terminal hydrolase 4 isoform X2 [Bos indicus]XP_027379716.1 ubiquitin carboxyl-terminal hydrolase 4 isoform X2 [Bos indicus x Bos taurus]
MAEGGGYRERPDAETQKSELGALMRTTLQRGAQWYLIDSRWFKQWKKYVGFDSWDMYNVGEHNLYPGPIDNSGLFSDPESQTLKEHLIDELDYVLVPAEAWNKLLNWYGCVEGQQPIVRKVVEHGLFVKHCKVEVYLLELKLCENSDPTNVLSCHFSKADTIATIEKEMRKLFNIPAERETRLWNKYMSNTYEQLSKLDNTVQDAGLYQGQVLVIEPQNEDGTWPRQTQQSNGSGFSASYNCQESPLTHVQPGLCGLGNLGNTCFMNSALQCLSNTAPLTDYFLKDEYEAEINRDNPLGMKGEIAEAYAELIKQMWSGRDAHVAPRMFKTQVGRFAPQFSGYQQQDSQELLAFLLDGLHEDLNRVKKKPYLELKDANGRPDAVVAKEAWENHRLRNDSVIVDTFHGLFKSTLVCPECAKVSVTFDPFCYLTLPLPLKKDRVMEIFLVPADPRCRPTQYRVVVPLMGAVSDLCEALSKLSGIAAENMVVTDVYNHRFHKIFQMDEGLNHIMPRDDIFVYEVCSTSPDGSECVTLPVYFRERKSRPSSTSTGAVLYGQPLLVSVPKHKLTLESLYQAVCERISRYIKQPLPDESGSSPLELGACNGSRSGCAGEDEEEMEHQEEGREQLSETEGSGDDEPGSDHGEATQKKNKGRPCPRRLFTFSLVNSYGTADINSLATDGKLLKLNSRSTLAIDWDSETRSCYYNEQESETYEKHVSMLQPQKKKKTAVALRDCIELFTTMETLGEHDPWYCPNCKKHQQATKKFDLWSLPKILVVHLKRFSYNRYWRDKLDTVVEFPVRGLNMSEFVCDPSARPYVYDLIAVSNHYGAMGVGHYTAYAKNKLNGKWYYFDDSNVSLACEDQIVTKAAYVLFYQRRDDEFHKTPSLSFPGSSDGGARPSSSQQGTGDDETYSMDTN